MYAYIFLLNFSTQLSFLENIHERHVSFRYHKYVYLYLYNRFSITNRFSNQRYREKKGGSSEQASRLRQNTKDNTVIYRSSVGFCNLITYSCCVALIQGKVGKNSTFILRKRCRERYFWDRLLEIVCSR